VNIKCLAPDTEICVQKIKNSTEFEPCFYSQKDVRCDEFGKGTMQETSTRQVRTVFDADSAPYSNMVMGEVINFPGKWSSYPPHDHPQPEIYHYRFDKPDGFGISIHEEDAFIIHQNDTMAISPHKVHSQVSAPGYAMYYIWLIPHLKEDRFGANSRNFREEHHWLLDPDAKIWPDNKK
ncbi:MAG: 5-deoxy-glucuronate isomerase, partial [Spirochaetes bacterium]|nr:5-deoxy-glucuronate isomerase [Spirochaetota bacterium]